MSNPFREGRARLPDGRHLGYAEYGAPGGRPFFYFHGLPGSRLEIVLADLPARQRGLRLIALDRPGIGLSDPRPGRTLADWPETVAALAEHLEISRFGVLGVSGGGPYALACARYLADQLTAVGIVCGLAPPEMPGFTEGMTPVAAGLLNSARYTPLLAAQLGYGMGWSMARFPGLVLNLAGAGAPASDRLTLNRPEVRETILRSMEQAFSQGSRGAVDDLLLYARSWGFRLQDIDMPVHLWQGEADHIVPPSMGRYLAEHLPRREARFYPGEGHFSLPFEHIDKILDSLANG